MGRYIILNKSNKVIAVRTGPSIVAGEIESDAGDIGQIYQNGVFINVAIPAPKPAETIEDRLTRIEAKLDAISPA